MIKLPKIDDKATKKAVEKALYRYRDYLVTLPMFLMPKVTPSYSLVPPSNTNAFHSSTEDAAIERIQYIEERDSYLENIHGAVNTLKDIEREIIIKKYLQHDASYDPLIWAELGVGRSKFYVIKSEAMLRLAFALKIEVYKNKG
ncbi:ArpU family phage packaging/lysis transcriptional regulator [Peribacillus loiseleuriae]|uniref:ArpU family transcriptional regulator n=1 Tax=Peribacillus loiseleuriae TaxID=1679170 RepID=A0A0K9GSE3_9BACI|nr:ArpU family phage packaging/lysis transcriptional regulator [Peribacillus loiseleuriae]KMY49550.1 ArpU family transcriptional regulator [Peribacillus loiseleuriae]